MNKTIDEVLDGILEKRRTNNTYRFLTKPAQGAIDFTSNDYLGLAKIPADETLLAHDGTYAASGSRLLSGNKSYHEAIEQYCVSYFNAEACLLFNSGYMANLGLLSSVPQKGDVILMDELSHACIKEGVRLSRAKYFNFRHNDVEDLKKKLMANDKAGNIFVVVESVYSMDGDESPLEAIVSLKGEFSFNLIVDEAHTTALYEKHGAGLVADKGLQSKVFAVIYTFGKAAGAHGAVVAGSTTLKNYLINYARSFIYTTALPFETVSLILTHLKYRFENPQLLNSIYDKIALFRSTLLPEITLLNSKHPVQGIIINGESAVIEFSNYLNAKGFYTRPIVHPTVPKGQERVRICIHTFNTDDEIKRLTNHINNYFKTLAI